MNTSEINYILSNDCVTQKYFDGVYAKDVLKEIKDKPKLIICNTDTSKGEGIHWVLLFFNEKDVEFFDSLGKKPSDSGNEFVSFMKKFNYNYCICSVNRIQPLNSDLCSHYCISYAHKRCQGYDMSFILNNFPQPLKIKKFLKHFSIIMTRNMKKIRNVA